MNNTQYIGVGDRVKLYSRKYEGFLIENRSFEFLSKDIEWYTQEDHVFVVMDRYQDLNDNGIATYTVVHPSECGVVVLKVTDTNIATFIPSL